jgi:hypothetical protein
LTDLTEKLTPDEIISSAIMVDCFNETFQTQTATLKVQKTLQRLEVF